MKIRRSGQTVALLAACMLVFAGCGNGPEPANGGPRVGENLADWETPRPGDTVKVESLAEGVDVGDLLFQPVTPAIGPPDGTFVTKADPEQPEEGSVFLVYHENAGDPYWIVERSAGPSWKDNFDELVAECAPPSCEADLSVVIVRSDVRALLTETEDETVLLWKEGDLEFRVIGPSSTLPAEDAIAVANSI